jgi:hypothetical protein
MPSALDPQEDFWYSCWGISPPPARSAALSIRCNGKSGDLIGNRSQDFPVLQHSASTKCGSAWRLPFRLTALFECVDACNTCSVPTDIDPCRFECRFPISGWGVTSPVDGHSPCNPVECGCIYVALTQRLGSIRRVIL